MYGQIKNADEDYNHGQRMEKHIQREEVIK